MHAADAHGQPSIAFPLRRATSLDAAAIHAQVQAVYAPLAGTLPESTVFGEGLPQVLAAFERGPVWVIEVQRRIVASVRADLHHDDKKEPVSWVEVHRLAVLPEYAGLGFGSRLMQAVEGFAAAAIAPPLPALVALEVRAAQPESEAFYCRLGYENVGVGLWLRTGAPRSYRMQKTVARPVAGELTSAQT